MSVYPDRLQALADMCSEAGRLLDEVATELASDGLTSMSRACREASVKADAIVVGINDNRRASQP